MVVVIELCKCCGVHLNNFAVWSRDRNHERISVCAVLRRDCDDVSENGTGSPGATTGANTSLSIIRRNTTGVTILASELDGKRQEILIEAVPGVRRIAVLADANVSTPPRLRALEEAARARGIELSIHSVTHREEIGSAIDAVKAVGAEG